MDMTSRVHRWLASAWGLHPAARDPAAGEPGLPDSEAIRQAMRMAVAPCSNAHRSLAAWQIARADSVVGLWLLRSSLYQYLAQDLGQAEADRRCTALLALFENVVPGNVPGRRIGENGAHGQRLY